MSWHWRLEEGKLSLHGLVDLISQSREFQAIREKTARHEKQLILGYQAHSASDDCCYQTRKL